jgi:hypothetical protein
MENPPGLERGMTDLMSYYPSVPYAEGAPEFEVKAGVRVDGINVKLLRGKTYFVRGKVTFNGAPVKGSFSMRVTNPPPATGAGSWTCMVRDGLFTMHDQSPGPHLMEVLSAGSEMPMRGLVGKMVFTITDSDVDVVFPLEQGVEVSGVLRAEWDDWQSYVSAGKGPSGSPAPIPRPAILLTAIESRNARSYGQANDAGAFTLTPAIAGDYLLDVTGLSKGSYVKSVRYGAGDATQGPLRVESSAAKLEIEISSKGASVNGVLRGDKGEPLSGYVVSVWPRTPNLWSATHGVQSTSSDQRGTFKISGLAPGKYYVAAFEEIESGLRQFPVFLEKFENRAESVDLSEGSQASANVKPIPKEAAEAEVAKLP